MNLLRSDYGFRPEQVLTATISLPRVNYHTAKTMASFYERLDTNLKNLPGVGEVGIGSDVPWTGYDDNSSFNIENKKPPPGEEIHGRYHAASSGYFRALNIPLVRGRFFADSDTQDSRNVFIINERMARLYWGREDPVGSRITFEDSPKDAKDWYTVVGVVGDVKDTPNAPAAEAAFWWALPQQPTYFNSMSVVVRARLDPAVLASEMRRVVQQLDPTIALADIRPMNTIADESFSSARFSLFLIVLFAGLALTLAAIGTYGVISYSVNQRSREFGVRIALGAQSSDVLRLVFREGLGLAALGIVSGLLVGVALSRVLGSLLYEVGAMDPATILAVATLTAVIAALACYIPARRATRAQPITALRAE